MFEHKPDKASTAVAAHADKTRVWLLTPLPKIKAYVSSLVRWVSEGLTVSHQRRYVRTNIAARRDFFSRRMLLKTLGATMLLSAGAGTEQAAAFILHGGTPSAPPPPSGTIQTFQVANWANASTPGFIRLGLPFRRGDVPAGNVVQILRNGVPVAAQFDERVTFKMSPYTGGLRLTISHMRDSAFAALETRTYQVATVAGSWNNTGSLSVNDIIANSNFKLAFNNVLACDGSIDTVNYVITDPGLNITSCTPHINDSGGGQGSNAAATATLTGGQLTALTITNTNYRQYALPVITFTGTVGAGGRLPSATVRAHTFAYNYSAMSLSTNTLFNQTISGVATRVTKIASGPVCEGWIVWGMATDNVTGNPDPHLKGVAEVRLWKNSNGTIADIEHVLEAQLNWWQTTGKQRLQYDAVYSNNGTTIQSYPAVVHGYGAHWVTVRMTNNVTKDLSAYRPFWLNQIPTLTYQPDRLYWVASGLAPPLDAASAVAGQITFGANPFANFVYVPGASMGFNNQIDGTGGSNARGVFSSIDAFAFLSQRPIDVLLARNSSLTSLSVPYHFRLETSRKRPQDAGVADMANTVPSPILTVLGGGAPLVTSYDFSYQGSANSGMPPPAHSYWGFNTPSQYFNSYSLRPNMDGTAGPIGPYWQLSPAASHASPYGSLFMYLLEGNRYHLEALLDLASNVTTQNFGFSGSLTGLLYANQNYWNTLGAHSPIPGWTYFAVGNMQVASNTRATGWALGLLGAVVGVCPDSASESPMFIALNQQNLRYCSVNYTYMPPSQLAFGCWIDGGGGSFGAIGHWHHSFIGMCAYYNHTVSEDPDALTLGNFIATLQIGIINTYPYRAIVDHLQSNPLVAGPTGGGWSPTNEFMSLAGSPLAPSYGCVCSNISSTTNTLTFSTGIAGAGSSAGWFGFLNGDQLWIGGLDDSGGHGYTIPTELTQGIPYYVYNPVDTGAGTGTCQLATSPNYPSSGSLVTFGTNYTGPMYFGFLCSQLNQTPAANRTIGGHLSSFMPGADNFASIGHVVRTYAVMYGKAGALTAYNNSTAFLTEVNAALYGNTISQNFTWATAVPTNFVVADSVKRDPFRNVAANDNHYRCRMAAKQVARRLAA